MCTTDLAVADDVRGGGCGLQWVRDGVGWRDGPAVGGGRASGGWENILLPSRKRAARARLLGRVGAQALRVEAAATLEDLGVPLGFVPADRIPLLPAVASEERRTESLHRHLLVLVRALDVGEGGHVVLEPPSVRSPLGSPAAAAAVLVLRTVRS